MIIKRNKQKQQNIKKQESLQPVSVPTEEQSVVVENEFVNNEESIASEPEIQTEEIKEPEENIKEEKIDIFADFNFDEINYKQRAERRRGDRRRGYRRIDDRNLISRAQQEAILIKEQASKDGYDKGLEQAQEAVTELRNSINEFFEYKEEMYKKLSEDYLEIAVAIAEKIIKKEVETDKKVLDSIIHDALGSLAKDENKIILKVNPTDVEYTKEIIPKLLSSGQFEAKIYVTGDKEISEGSTIIETSNGVIDATINTQLELIKEAFKQI